MKYIPLAIESSYAFLWQLTQQVSGLPPALRPLRAVAFRGPMELILFSA
jgi:hypothetical protein